MTGPQKFFSFGVLLSIIMLLISDSNLGLIQGMVVGEELVLLLTKLSTSIMFIAVLYMATEAFLSYINTIYGELYKRAIRSSEGSAMVFIGIAIMMLSLAILIFAATN